MECVYSKKFTGHAKYVQAVSSGGAAAGQMYERIKDSLRRLELAEAGF